MDSSVYEVYEDLERKHWWNIARRRLILSLLEGHFPSLDKARVVDIGAGSGAFLQFFEKRNIQAEAHDGSSEAVEHIRRHTRLPVYRRHFPEDYGPQDFEKYDVVLLLDVLEHLQDDRTAFQTAVKLLKREGLLFCTVPACKKMWSEYDIMAHHFRRYAQKELLELVTHPEVEIRKLSHFSTFLFPILFLVRFVEHRIYRRSGKEAVFRPHFLPEILNRVLFHIFDLEKGLLGHFNFWFGSSLMVILRKK